MIKYIEIGFFIICFYTSLTYAQSYTVSGKITDSLSKPLLYTNILAKPLSQQIDMAFAITDEQGRFKLMAYTIEEK